MIVLSLNLSSDRASLFVGEVVGMGVVDGVEGSSVFWQVCGARTAGGSGRQCGVLFSTHALLGPVCF